MKSNEEANGWLNDLRAKLSFYSRLESRYSFLWFLRCNCKFVDRRSLWETSTSGMCWNCGYVVGGFAGKKIDDKRTVNFSSLNDGKMSKTFATCNESRISCKYLISITQQDFSHFFSTSRRNSKIFINWRGKIYGTRRFKILILLQLTVIIFGILWEWVKSRDNNVESFDCWLRVGRKIKKCLLWSRFSVEIWECKKISTKARVFCNFYKSFQKTFWHFFKTSKFKKRFLLIFKRFVKIILIIIFEKSKLSY